MLGLYVHIPFCSAICNYCNFNRGLFDGAQKTRYVDALIREIHETGMKACTTTEVVQAFRPVINASDAPAPTKATRAEVREAI